MKVVGSNGMYHLLQKPAKSVDERVNGELWTTPMATHITTKPPNFPYRKTYAWNSKQPVFLMVVSIGWFQILT